MIGNQKIVAEALSLQQSALITLYVLDGSRQGADLYRFYSGTDNGQPLVFQGDTYNPYPIESKNWEMKSSGTYPTPEITFANTFGFFSALVLAHHDLIGCKVIRRRTFEKYLDGRPDADPTAQFPDDVYFINRKTEETKDFCTFQLSSPMDVEDIALPRRQIIGNLCQWAYRSAECSFSSVLAVAELDGTPIPTPQNYRGMWSPAENYAVGDVVFIIGYRTLKRYFYCKSAHTAKAPPNSTYWIEDACSKEVRGGCQKRFGAAYQRSYGLPFGGFPAVERLPF